MTALMRVFVYGTLMRGQSNDIAHFTPAAQFVGGARVPGQLFDLGEYPGLRLCEHQAQPSWVCGEVYAIEAQLLAQLDALEEIGASKHDVRRREHGDEYRRVMTQVAWLDVQSPSQADSSMCWVYEINQAYLQGMQRIASGDWRLRPKAQARE
jgi:gamma-glutamylcyclotransferase (GGCT)/AIG2-like uncharacterized protein YtfP